MKNVLRSQREAKRIIRQFKPDAVIGTGGYICFPVLEAAHELHILTFVHESNAVPGLTTKLLAERERSRTGRSTMRRSRKTVTTQAIKARPRVNRIIMRRK